MATKDQIFQLLKPPCVNLSQVALKFASRGEGSKDVVKCLEELKKTLKDVLQKNGTLDNKLADYIFFPISHVLKASQKLPVHALEVSLDCLGILLKTGWRSKLAPDLGGQLLILLTYMASPTPSEGTIQNTSEELQAVAFNCLSELFQSLSLSPAGKASLLSTPNIPSLGHAITTLLEGIFNGISREIQLAASDALNHLCKAIAERDVLSSFLPGIVSTLTKVLTPSTKVRRNFRVIATSIDIFSLLLRAVVSDEQTKDLPEISTVTLSDGATHKQLTQTWLKDTAQQLKVALATIVKLRQHDRIEVRRALAGLCTTVLQTCRVSLADSASVMVETMIIMANIDHDNDIEFMLQEVITSDEGLLDLLKSSTYTWIVSMPRIMQSKDDMSKHRVLSQISTAIRILADHGSDLTFVNHTIARNLRDSVSNIIHDSKSATPVNIASSESLISISSSLQPLLKFQPLFINSSGQEGAISDVKRLLRNLSQVDQPLSIARELSQFTQMNTGESQVASFWLSLNLLRAVYEENQDVNQFIDFGSTLPDSMSDILDELYSFSLDILTDSHLDSETDWRVRALALETVSLQATQLSTSFKIELVDALYPVLHCLGSSNPNIQHHALITLNILSHACGYRDAGDMIVSNVDYLVNAVALKLNTFDISPQAPLVLSMMVKLSGPSLLPYLDDLIGSIFTALEYFHGYSKLVELLFSSLTAIAQEGVKNPHLLIEPGESRTLRKRDYYPPSILDVMQTVKNMQERKTIGEEEHEEFPRRPWTESQTPNNDDNNNDDDDGAIKSNEGNEGNEDIDAPEGAASTEIQPPAPKTYALLLKISELTQHYLTSSSPSLRRSLLTLLDNTIPALSAHENSFLPLVNTLWPIIISRLEDNEAYIIASAIDVISIMCVHAGDFMRSRISELWGMLKRLHSRYMTRSTASSRPHELSTQLSRLTIQSLGAITADNQVSIDKDTRPDGQEFYYVDAPRRIVTDSLIRLLTTIVESVTIDGAMFDDMLDMLEPVMEKREDVRKCLEKHNADAVWLRDLKRGIVNGNDVHSFFPTIDPADVARWNFVNILGY